ncbi:MAG TPA: response regulator [Gemmatimonadaceae bacterium]|nr:response regulator [Gemmatimonadaceae bacterium]
MLPDSDAPDLLRILIADRRGWIARALVNVLDPAEWVVSHVPTADRVLDRIPEARPHLILVHDDLADMDAVELLIRLRAHPAVGLITPIVVVSTSPLRERPIEAMRAGATDYSVFPSKSESFILRLRALAVARREAERLEHASLLDADTGLYNATGLDRRAREIGTDAARRHDALSCVVFVPSAASLAPDERARAGAGLGAAIQRAGRLSDAIGRLDEVLVVVAPATGEPGARRLAERLHAVLERAADELTRQELADVPRVRASWCSVSDFARSTADVRQMIDRAIMTLQRDEGLATRPPAIIGETIPLADAQ